MKLKCIGGNCDGEIINVDNYYKVGDQIRVPAKIEFKLETFEEELKAFREGRTPEHLTIPYHYYRIAVLHFSKDDYFKFLVPNNWTDKDALKHQFMK